MCVCVARFGSVGVVTCSVWGLLSLEHQSDASIRKSQIDNSPAWNNSGDSRQILTTETIVSSKTENECLRIHWLKLQVQHN